jgi:anti-sigma-K factor RskA
VSDHNTYREWSAAYVLGALDAAERAEFERHLAECETCRSDVSSFAPIPGMLALVESPEIEAAPERIADRAVARLNADWADIIRSRRRWRLAAAVAAVAAVASLIVPLIPRSEPATQVLSLDPGASALGQIAVEAKGWGTEVTIRLDQLPQLDRYVAWVVSEDGEWQQIAVWGPTPAARARLTGASSYHTADLDRIVVTSEDRSATIATARLDDA